MRLGARQSGIAGYIRAQRRCGLLTCRQAIECVHGGSILRRRTEKRVTGAKNGHYAHGCTGLPGDGHRELAARMRRWLLRVSKQNIVGERGALQLHEGPAGLSHIEAQEGSPPLNSLLRCGGKFPIIRRHGARRNDGDGELTFT